MDTLSSFNPRCIYADDACVRPLLADQFSCGASSDLSPISTVSEQSFVQGRGGGEKIVNIITENGNELLKSATSRMEMEVRTSRWQVNLKSAMGRIAMEPHQTQVFKKCNDSGVSSRRDGQSSLGAR
jgi:hypothetical protein